MCCGALQGPGLPAVPRGLSGMSRSSAQGWRHTASAVRRCAGSTCSRDCRSACAKAWMLSQILSIEMPALALLLQ